MRVLTLRNLPDELYELIAARAARHRRSLQQEALTLLERVRSLEVSPLHQAAQIRAQLAGRALGDSVAEVRQERDR